jgi:hypothetical protein
VSALIASPILRSKPKSNVQVGASTIAVERHELVDEDPAHQNPYRSSCQGSASLW